MDGDGANGEFRTEDLDGDGASGKFRTELDVVITGDEEAGMIATDDVAGEMLGFEFPGEKAASGAVEVDDNVVTDVLAADVVATMSGADAEGVWFITEPLSAEDGADLTSIPMTIEGPLFLREFTTFDDDAVLTLAVVTPTDTFVGEALVTEGAADFFDSEAKRFGTGLSDMVSAAAFSDESETEVKLGEL